MKPDHQRLKVLLAESIAVLCKNGLQYKRQFSIRGLLGVTLDEDEVFLIDIHEHIGESEAPVLADCGKRAASPCEMTETSSSLPLKRKRSLYQPKNSQQYPNMTASTSVASRTAWSVSPSSDSPAGCQMWSSGNSNQEVESAHSVRTTHGENAGVRNLCKSENSNSDSHDASVVQIKSEHDEEISILETHEGAGSIGHNSVALPNMTNFNDGLGQVQESRCSKTTESCTVLDVGKSKLSQFAQESEMSSQPEIEVLDIRTIEDDVMIETAEDNVKTDIDSLGSPTEIAIQSGERGSVRTQTHGQGNHGNRTDKNMQGPVNVTIVGPSVAHTGSSELQVQSGMEKEIPIGGTKSRPLAGASHMESVCPTAAKAVATVTSTATMATTERDPDHQVVTTDTISDDNTVGGNDELGRKRLGQDANGQWIFMDASQYNIVRRVSRGASEFTRKMMPYLFTQEEMAKGSWFGGERKYAQKVIKTSSLCQTKLTVLTMLTKQEFPVEMEKMSEPCFREIINAKCRQMRR